MTRNKKNNEDVKDESAPQKGQEKGEDKTKPESQSEKCTFWADEMSLDAQGDEKGIE